MYVYYKLHSHAYYGRAQTNYTCTYIITKGWKLKHKILTLEMLLPSFKKACMLRVLLIFTEHLRQNCRRLRQGNFIRPQSCFFRIAGMTVLSVSSNKFNNDNCFLNFTLFLESVMLGHSWARPTASWAKMNWNVQTKPKQAIQCNIIIRRYWHWWILKNCWLAPCSQVIQK